MAVAFDNSASASGNRVASLTFSLTVGAGVTNGAVLVGIQDDDTGGRTISSVTVGGSAATLLRRDGASGSHAAIYWIATGSGTGAKSVVVTMSGAVSGDLIAGACSFSGCDQTTPAINDVGSSGTTAVPSLTVTSSSNDLVFDSAHSNTTATIAVGTGQTSRWNVTGPRNSTKGGGSTKAGAASVAMAWTTGTATHTAHCACDILAASSALTYSGTGGAVSSGSASATAGFKSSPSGGAVSSGAGIASANFKKSGGGGAVASGVAPSLPGFKMPGSGSLISGGAAAFKAGFAFAVSGTAVMRGGADFTGPSSGFTFSGSGGLIAGGSSQAHAAFVISASGTARASGAAITIAGYKSSISGGVVANGTAAVCGSFTFGPSGTLHASGVALASVTSSSSQASAQPNFFQADINAILSLPDFDDDALALFSFPDSFIEVDALMATQPDSFTAGGLTKPCVFMLHDQTFQQGHIGAGQQMAMGYALVKTADFPALKRGDAVIVNTVSFKVSLATRIQDGAITQVFLGKA